MIFISEKSKIISGTKTEPPTQRSKGMKNSFFILGANDLEMKAIEGLLSEKNLPFGYAAAPGRDGNVVRCHPGNAGKFTEIVSPDGEKISVENFDQVVLVECNPAEGVQTPEVIVVDHHKPGDPGFGKSPAEFEAGSSLGQIAKLLGVSLTKKQKAVAAADHCLTAAYQGECPGISKEDVLAVRLPELMTRHRMSESEVREEIAKAEKLLQNPQKTVTIGGQEIPDFRDYGILPFMVEAGTITGKPFLAHVDSRPGFEKKVMLNGNAAVVSAFLEEKAAKLGIVDTYGNPNRGFAGGTQQ